MPTLVEIPLKLGKTHKATTDQGSVELHDAHGQIGNDAASRVAPPIPSYELSIAQRSKALIEAAKMVVQYHFQGNSPEFARGLALIGEQEAQYKAHYLKTSKLLQQAGKIRNKTKQNKFINRLNLSLKQQHEQLAEQLTVILEMHCHMGVHKAAESLKIGDNMVNWLLPKESDSFETYGGRIDNITRTHITIQNDEFLLIQKDLPRTRPTPALIDEYLKIYATKPPKWFASLPRWTKALLKERLIPIKNAKASGATETQLADQFETIFATIPSTIRYFPGIANFTQHIEEYYEKSSTTHQWRLVLSSIRSRHSVLSPATMDYDTVVELAVLAIEQLIHDQFTQQAQKFITENSIRPNIENERLDFPLLLQTLLSPLRFDGALGRLFGLYTDNNGFMVSAKNKAAKLIQYKIDQDAYVYKLTAENGNDIYARPQVIAINHPVNEVPRKARFRWALARQSTSNTAGAKNLIATVTPLIARAPASTKTTLLERALHDYKTIRDAVGDAATTTRRVNHHLFQTGLENILTEGTGGIAAGSCKSGKDRKGMELIHTAAMKQYYIAYRKLPKYNDNKVERQNFVRIFVDIFFNNHELRNAAMNARGSNGLKSLKKVLPEDIIKEIFTSADVSYGWQKGISLLARALITLATVGIILAFKPKFLQKKRSKLLDAQQANASLNRPKPKIASLLTGWARFKRHGKYKKQVQKLYAKTRSSKPFYEKVLGRLGSEEATQQAAVSTSSAAAQMQLSQGIHLDKNAVLLQKIYQALGTKHHINIVETDGRSIELHESANSHATVVSIFQNRVDFSAFNKNEVIATGKLLYRESLKLDPNFRITVKIDQSVPNHAAMQQEIQQKLDAYRLANEFLISKKQKPNEPPVTPLLDPNN